MENPRRENHENTGRQEVSLSELVLGQKIKIKQPSRDPLEPGAEGMGCKAYFIDSVITKINIVDNPDDCYIETKDSVTLFGNSSVNEFTGKQLYMENNILYADPDTES
ncbi:MAG: hypothetical protein UX09_C0038G0010 [Candidatus Uhrbacteria bacterium GW2011_GWE2_45_35]|uniref:Uncharacterized protein n=1 Tax=Candidatus Uhrbacteria bacterium GW2011_GWE2_45_35 TaxID=1618993 RepID=A0A0G1PNC7_9BACT|nr:MAG: hypothetical protein UX09_C0038G0010 [Candidatus Uhrbacteria bacterium GW2011_GWE2_45_35]HBR80881.1 hypothetical protein [Candidatus Uhrbacteria bacterium]HCU31411.1 hypothetical protein [Candidatus Uhrbacteria bacterium]